MHLRRTAPARLDHNLQRRIGDGTELRRRQRLVLASNPDSLSLLTRGFAIRENSIRVRQAGRVRASARGEYSRVVLS